MTFKEKLFNLKNEITKITMYLSKQSTGNRDIEFNVSLENHPIGNQNIYRLYYVNYHRIGEYNGRNDNNIGIVNWQCRPFIFPKGMTREEGFKVLSYLTDFIEKRKDTEPCSLKSVRTLDAILDLERFGFTRINENDENKILDLFTVSGRIKLFKESKLYPRYFEWYVKNVTLKEVTNIYAKYNMTFKDIIWLDNQDDKNTSKVLKLQK